MSDIKKCDRCGDAYDPYNLSTNYGDEWWRYEVLKDSHPYEEIKVDLCPECRKKLYKWIKGKDN
jgi:hypothetical protein